MPFQTISDSEVAADAGGTTDLFTKLRDNQEFLNDSLKGWKLIQRHESTADEAEFDFTETLDGDTEKVYMLIGRALVDGALNLRLRLNGGITTAILADGTGGGGTAVVVFQAQIHVLRTVQTVSVDVGVLSNFFFQTATAPVGTAGTRVVIAANVTSLGVDLSGGDTDIEKGSEFTLYEVRQS